MHHSFARWFKSAKFYKYASKLAILNSVHDFFLHFNIFHRNWPMESYSIIVWSCIVDPQCLAEPKKIFHIFFVAANVTNQIIINKYYCERSEDTNQWFAVKRHCIVEAIAFRFHCWCDSIWFILSFTVFSFGSIHAFFNNHCT